MIEMILIFIGGVLVGSIGQSVCDARNKRPIDCAETYGELKWIICQTPAAMRPLKKAAPVHGSTTIMAKAYLAVMVMLNFGSMATVRFMRAAKPTNER